MPARHKGLTETLLFLWDRLGQIFQQPQILGFRTHRHAQPFGESITIYWAGYYAIHLQRIENRQPISNLHQQEVALPWDVLKS